MKPVNVFLRIDPLKHCLLVYVLWQRKLDEDPVDVRTGVQ